MNCPIVPVFNFWLLYMAHCRVYVIAIFTPDPNWSFTVTSHSFITSQYKRYISRNLKLKWADLSMKQGSSFCFVCHYEISNHCTSCCALGIFGKVLMSRVHWLGLRLFGTPVRKLLIIEPFSQWKLNKIKIENCIGIWGCYWHCWKALSRAMRSFKPQSDLIKVISQFSKLRCGRCWFFSGFCCWKFKQIAKIVFGRKN
jgi:hypothetical protein